MWQESTFTSDQTYLVLVTQAYRYVCMNVMETYDKIMNMAYIKQRVLRDNFHSKI